MSTISENLQTLNEAKKAIKTAIENKGQDLTDVPFTQYAEKIEAISGADADIISLQKHIDRNKIVANLFDGRTTKDNQWTQEEIDYYMSKLDFSKVTRFESMFSNLGNVKKVPYFDTSNATYSSALYVSSGVEEVPLLDLRKTTNCSSMHQYNNIEICPAYDLRSATTLNNIVNQCKKLKEIWIRNIKTSITVGSGSTYGHLLTLESIIHLIKELRDTGSMKTLTMGTVNIEKLANVYVRTIEITDEMRAEDDLIDEKLPFEVCESTDNGAILITSYAALKNWNIA